MAKTRKEKPTEITDRLHKAAFALLRTMQREGLAVWECEAAMALALYLLNWTPTDKAFDLDDLEDLTAGQLAADMISWLSSQNH